MQAIVECSAEPSVLAGMGGGADYVVQTNLIGAHNCLELARRDGSQIIFISTSRVYPVAPLQRLALREGETRFALDDQPLAGASAAGIAEEFPLEGARTLYGATKLAAELLVAEYADTFGVRGGGGSLWRDRGAVADGQGRPGRLHALAALPPRGRPLTYIGYGGTGKQVRDVLHVDDLCDLIFDQLAEPAAGTARR